MVVIGGSVVVEVVGTVVVEAVRIWYKVQKRSDIGYEWKKE